MKRRPLDIRDAQGWIEYMKDGISIFNDESSEDSNSTACDQALSENSDMDLGEDNFHEDDNNMDLGIDSDTEAAHENCSISSIHKLDITQPDIPQNKARSSNTFSCGNCTFITTIKKDLVTHLQSKHRDERLICPQCAPRSFAHTNSLAAHNSFYHNNKIKKAAVYEKPEKPQRKRNNNQLNSNKKDLLTHTLQAHPNKETFSCAICAKTYMNRNSLCKHKSRNHKNK